MSDERQRYRARRYPGPTPHFFSIHSQTLVDLASFSLAHHRRWAPPFIRFSSRYGLPWPCMQNGGVARGPFGHPCRRPGWGWDWSLGLNWDKLLLLLSRGMAWAGMMGG